MGINTTKKLVLGIALFMISFNPVFGQDYKTHKVQVGETIESIAKQYMVTPYDIYALNPDAKTSLQPNMVIIIPKSRVSDKPTVTESREVYSFKKHKVKRRETLFSISKRYNISVDDIKKYNKRLYSETLRKGDRIEIPQYKTIRVTNTLENTIKSYTVLPKEGKWRVAYKYGITVDELERINPKLGDTLRVGEIINVPNIADNEIQTVDDSYGYYTVLPKEGYYRLKLKLGMDQQELEALNPQLKEGGLKAGMVLKVPKDVGENNPLGNIERTALSSRLKNFERKRIAVMLPFRLHRIDFDSIQEARDILENDAYMNISVDFHSGVLMALDSASKLGISTKLDVFDTRARLNEVSKIINSNNFSEYDAVIGPFTSASFDRAAEALKRDNIPIFAAVTKPKNLYSNVYQTVPSDEFLRKKLIEFVKADTSEKNILIISDAKNKGLSNKLSQELTGTGQIFSRTNKEGRDAYYILADDIRNVLKKGKTFVFLETDNEGFVSNVTSILSALNGTVIDEDGVIQREIILMTTNRNRAFEGNNISNLDLSSLQFHFPSVNRSLDENGPSSFSEKYKREFRAEPNKYVLRGFDLTMDILLRLASEDDLYDASNSDIETEYVANKFRYSKKLFGGYYNESAYIVKYEDLRLVEVKQ
ncbi:MAG: LysM peptidoglycan-binding domain-containing protein [Flavobacteriaceae bacterium]|nr:LysM peptidoglycan-binding domain-containing protein [Flavobacteriaceae bacterium]